MIFLFTRPPLIPRTPYGGYASSLFFSSLSRSVPLPSVRKPKPALSRLLSSAAAYQAAAAASRRLRRSLLGKVRVHEGTHGGHSLSFRCFFYISAIILPCRQSSLESSYPDSRIKFKKVWLKLIDKVKEFQRRIIRTLLRKKMFGFNDDLLPSDSTSNIETRLFFGENFARDYYFYLLSAFSLYN